MCEKKNKMADLVVRKNEMMKMKSPFPNPKVKVGNLGKLLFLATITLMQIQEVIVKKVKKNMNLGHVHRCFSIRPKQSIGM